MSDENGKSRNWKKLLLFTMPFIPLLLTVGKKKVAIAGSMIVLLSIITPPAVAELWVDDGSTYFTAYDGRNIDGNGTLDIDGVATFGDDVNIDADIKSANAINFKPNADVDDYLQVTTVGDNTFLRWLGTTANLLSADDYRFYFDNQNTDYLSLERTGEDYEIKSNLATDNLTVNMDTYFNKDMTLADGEIFNISTMFQIYGIQSTADAYIKGIPVVGGQGNSLFIQAGTTTGTLGGVMTFAGGSGQEGGSLTFSGGKGTAGDGGDLELTAGGGTGGTGGDVILTSGSPNGIVKVGTSSSTPNHLAGDVGQLYLFSALESEGGAYMGGATHFSQLDNNGNLIFYGGANDISSSTDNVTVDDNLTVNRDVYANRYYGDGSQLTGISATGGSEWNDDGSTLFPDGTRDVRSNESTYLGSGANHVKFESDGDFRKYGTSDYLIGADEKPYTYQLDEDYYHQFYTTGGSYRFTSAISGSPYPIFDLFATTGAGFNRGSLRLGINTDVKLMFSHPDYANTGTLEWKEDEYTFNMSSEEDSTKVTLEVDGTTTQDIMHLNVQTSAPSSPVDGDVVYADGTSWDPGSGEGIYAYYNTAWNYLG